MLIKQVEQISYFFQKNIVPESISSKIGKDLFLLFGSISDRTFDENNNLIQISLFNPKEQFIILELGSHTCQPNHNLYYTSSFSTFEPRFNDAANFNHEICILICQGIIYRLNIINNAGLPVTNNANPVFLAASSGPGNPSNVCKHPILGKLC